MAIKRDSLDAIFSDLVRERAGQRSEYSGKPGRLECCHVYGRRKKSVRWHPLNAVALTHDEHRYFTENPVLFATWCNSRFGADQMYQLAMLASAPRKFSAREKAGLLRHYKAEHERMMSARANGRSGRIEFIWPDPIIEVEPRKKTAKKKASTAAKPIVNKGFDKTKRRKISGEVVERSGAARMA